MSYLISRIWVFKVSFLVWETGIYNNLSEFQYFIRIGKYRKYLCWVGDPSVVSWNNEQ